MAPMSSAPLSRRAWNRPVREETRRAILGEALNLFSQRGYAATPLRDIAEPLGLTVAAIYYHYPSKDALLADVAEPLLSDYNRVLEAAESSQPRSLLARRRELLTNILDVVIRHRDLFRFVTRDLAFLNHPTLGPRRDDQLKRFRALLAGPDDSQEAELRASAALGVLFGPAANLPDLKLEDQRQTLVNAALRALHTRRPAT